MTPQNIYRVIAMSNAGFGVLLAAGVLSGAFKVFSSEEVKTSLVGGALLTLIALIAISLIYTAIDHLKRPSRKSTLALSTNSSVIIWFVLNAVLGTTGLKAIVGPVYVGIALGLAYLCHRFFLRPLALRVSPVDENGA